MSRRACFALSVLLFVPVRGDAYSICTSWNGKVCAETVRPLEENLYLVATTAKPVAATPIVPSDQKETADLHIGVVTPPNTTALVIDLEHLIQLLLGTKPELVAEMMTKCSDGLTAPDCESVVRQLWDDETNREAVKTATLWGHACANAGHIDDAEKTITDVTLEPPTIPLLTELGGRYWVVAVAAGEEGFFRNVTEARVRVTHHSMRSPKIQCGAPQQGTLPGPGDYVNQIIGNVKIDLPKDLGTPSLQYTNLRFVARSLIARGTFALSPPDPALDATVQLLFTGRIADCSKILGAVVEPLPGPE